MPRELVMGLMVDDDAGYARYRELMRPLLAEHGGGFRYDFRVSEVLATRADHPINRVFTIHFRDRGARAAFFADPRYREIRRRWFEPSVRAATVIGEYERDGA